MAIIDNKVTCGPQCGEEFDALSIGEWFIYDGSFPAWKVSGSRAVFANREGRFINAMRYDNCLSIGSDLVLEFDTFEEAANYRKEFD